MMAALAGASAWRESATIDEVIHIGAGLSYLQKLDLRLNEEHPPLAKVIAAAPLAARGARADYTDYSWTVSRDYFPAFVGQIVWGERVVNQWNDPASTTVWMRIPMLLLMLALGWVVYVFAYRLGGEWGGLLCLAVYASTPIFLAMGPLVHTDVPATLFTLLALWRLGELWRDPSRKNAALFGLSLAGALLSKFTATLLFVVLAGLAVSLWWRVPGAEVARAEARMWRRRRWRASWRGILWALAAVYVVYFVLSWNQPTNSLAFIGHSPIALVARRILMAPWLYLRGLFMVVLTSTRPTFILGQNYSHGVWFYFPVLLVLKSAPGFLGLLALAAGAALFRKGPAIDPKRGIYWRIVWIALAVYTAACLASQVNIGFRHFSVPLVLLILLLAPLPRLLQLLRGGRVLTALAAVLALSCLATAVWAFPFYFPYTSPLRMGQPAWDLMADSNLDWGQTLPEARRFAERHAIRSLPLDAFSLSDTRVAVPQSHVWNCQAPSEQDAGQWAVISANMIHYVENCRWLMDYPHEALGGGSLFAVRLPAPIPPAGSPGGPPVPADRKLFFGSQNGVDSRIMMLGLYHHPERMLEAAATVQRGFEDYAATQAPWLKKLSEEPGR